MKAGLHVKNKVTGKTGYTVDDFGGMMSVTEEGETLVVYEGTTYGDGTTDSDLEVLGNYEATPDHEKCGAGRGKEACIFLVLGSGGFACARFGELRNAIIFRTMVAERNPAENYPECMKF